MGVDLGNDYSIESAECTADLIFAVYENATSIKEHRDLRNRALFLIYDQELDTPEDQEAAERLTVDQGAWEARALRLE